MMRDIVKRLQALAAKVEGATSRRPTKGTASLYVPYEHIAEQVHAVSMMQWVLHAHKIDSTSFWRQYLFQFYDKRDIEKMAKDVLDKLGKYAQVSTRIAAAKEPRGADKVNLHISLEYIAERANPTLMFQWFIKVHKITAEKFWQQYLFLLYDQEDVVKMMREIQDALS